MTVLKNVDAQRLNTSNMGTKGIDEKHNIEAYVDANGFVQINIVKKTNGQVIPHNEPTILFRGRDKLALPMLKHYRRLCQNDGATEYQLESIDKMILAFQQFEQNNPQVMKQPGITMGK